MRKLLEEADELEQAGLICTERKNLGRISHVSIFRSV